MLPCLISSVLNQVFFFKNILSVILVVSGGKVNLVPVPPSGLEVEVAYLGFTQWFLLLFGVLFKWALALARPSDLLYVSASSLHPEIPSFALNL